MTQNQILVSSDHHANWQALEKLFEYAKENNFPFIINGDVIGDYNFEELAKNLNLKFPYEITNEKLKEKLTSEEIESYATYQQIAQVGSLQPFLNQVPSHLIEDTKQKLTNIIKFIESKEFQEKIKKAELEIEGLTKNIIGEHKIKLKALYNVVIKEHAKIFANIIEKYQVQTFFLNGNHEPQDFVDIVKSYLENKELLIDLGEIKGILEINKIKIAGISNVSTLMPFLNDIYSEKELDKMFSHQRGQNRPILYKNITKEKILSSEQYKQDIDWIRIAENKTEINLDVFFTHGQIGKGAWRDDRQADEMPTLYVAAMLSYLAQITIDGHLHTTYEMQTPFGKPLIRAIGNFAYKLTKNNDKIEFEKIQVDASYTHGNGMSFNISDLNKKVMQEIWENRGI